MEQIIVVVIMNNVVNDCKLFDDVKLAEQEFIEAVKLRLWRGDNVNDMESYLEDGYYPFEDGSVCITHPQPCSKRLVQCSWETYCTKDRVVPVADYDERVKVTLTANTTEHYLDGVLVARASYYNGAEPIYELAQYLV